jgi:hypothetical protein
MVMARLGGWEAAVPTVSASALFALVAVWLASGIAAVWCGLLAKAPTRRRRTRVVVAMVLSSMALLVVPGFAVDLVLSRGGHPPSDGALIENFREHEADFVALADRLQTADSVGHGRLRALHVESLLYYDKDDFELWVASWGIVPSGWAKGYVYSTRPPEQTADNLDRHAQADGFTCRHIEGPWYLFYDVW